MKSVAFKLGGAPDNQISVDLARLTTPQESVGRANKSGCGLGVLQAKIPRSLDFNVEHKPIPSNPAHSQIEGQNNKQKCRLLAEATEVVIHPQLISD